MSFYGDMATTARDLLRQFGEPATLSVQTGSEFDPINMINVPTYQDYSCFCYVGNYSGRVNDSGQLVQTSDRKLLVSGLGVSLEPGMAATVTVGGVLYASQNIKPVGGQGIQAIYIIQGRA